MCIYIGEHSDLLIGLPCSSRRSVKTACHCVAFIEKTQIRSFYLPICLFDKTLPNSWVTLIAHVR